MLPKLTLSTCSLDHTFDYSALPSKQSKYHSTAPFQHLCAICCCCLTRRKRNEWFEIDLTVDWQGSTCCGRGWLVGWLFVFSVHSVSVMRLFFSNLFGLMVGIKGFTFWLSIAYNCKLLANERNDTVPLLLHFKIFGCKYLKPSKVSYLYGQDSYRKRREREKYKRRNTDDNVAYTVWLLIGLVWHSNFSRFSMSFKLNGFGVCLSLFCRRVRIKYKT